MGEEARLCVCEHCLWAIESREGNQRSLRLNVQTCYDDETGDYAGDFVEDSNGFVHTLCDWCGEPICGATYEIG